MSKEQFARELDGCEMHFKLSPFTKRCAIKEGIVIVYGASDDLVEFEGAINDEICHYENDNAILVDRKGVPPPRDQIEDDVALEDFFIRRKTAKKIFAYYDCDFDYYWKFRTAIPHATFDVKETGEDKLFCRGIVFSMEDL